MLIVHEGEELVSVRKTIRVSPAMLERMQREGAVEVFKAESLKALRSLSHRIARQEFGGGAC